MSFKPSQEIITSIQTKEGEILLLIIDNTQSFHHCVLDLALMAMLGNLYIDVVHVLTITFLQGEHPGDKLAHVENLQIIVCHQLIILTDGLVHSLM